MDPTTCHDDADYTPDPDFELLESYLDGELLPAEIARLERRLRAEPELAEALGRMSAEHAIREAVWKSLEPTEPEVLKLTKGVASSARRTDLRRRLTRLSRFAGAAAACITVGFLAGWVGRGNATAQAGTDGANRAGMVQPSIRTRGTGTTQPTGAGGRGSPAAASKPAEPFAYQVALTDDAGNITAVQKFDNMEDARNFAADVGRWQARQQQIQQGQPIVTSSGL